MKSAPLKAIVLISGGLDSTTCLAYALSQGYECHALSFDYGQRHRAELDAAKRIANHYNLPHTVFKLDMSQFGGSALTDENITVPDHDENNTTIPITYVPARNTIFLSIALALAEVKHAYNIFLGASSVDYSGYPDCRPEYMNAFQKLANLATKESTENGHHITLHTPLMHMSKAETIQLGLSHEVDYSMTVSCYQATDDGRACGRCDSCTYRKKGFTDLGAKDPTRYV